MKEIDKPFIPVTTGGIIYQVTLASGMIITGPDGFYSTSERRPGNRVIVTEDGKVLVTPELEPSTTYLVA
jgi:hypothetical protein